MPAAVPLLPQLRAGARVDERDRPVARDSELASALRAARQRDPSRLHVLLKGEERLEEMLAAERLALPALRRWRPLGRGPASDEQQATRHTTSHTSHDKSTSQVQVSCCTASHMLQVTNGGRPFGGGPPHVGTLRAAHREAVRACSSTREKLHATSHKLTFRCYKLPATSFREAVTSRAGRRAHRTAAQARGRARAPRGPAAAAAASAARRRRG